MDNQVIEINDKASINLTPAQIDMKGIDELESYVNEAVNRANSLIVSAETLAEDKRDRAELNKIVNSVKRIRIDTKKKLTAPYDEIEKRLKQIEKNGKNGADQFASNINEIVEQARKSKKAMIQEWINSSAPNYDVDPLDIEIHDDWLNKSTSNKQWQEEVVDQFKTIKEYNERRRMSEEQIKMTARMLGVKETLPYINLLNHDMTALEIQKQMESDVEKQKAQQAEREATEKVVKDKVVNKETGEFKQLISTTLKLSGTVEQLNYLKTFMENQGIKYKKVD